MLTDAEVDQDIVFDTLDGIDEELEEKAENYAKVIRTFEADIDAIDVEIKRLQAMKKTRTNAIERLKKHLFDSMKATKKEKFTHGLFSFSIRKNGGVAPVIIDPKAAILPEFLVIPDPVPDKKKIADYLKTNSNCEWARFGERGESLVIK